MSFEGTVVIKPTTVDSKDFIFRPQAARYEKGGIPLGTTIVSCTAYAFDEDDNDVTSQMIIGSQQITTRNFQNIIESIVNVNYKYPAEAGAGRYYWSLHYTRSDGVTDQESFYSVVVNDDL